MKKLLFLFGFLMLFFAGVNAQNYNGYNVTAKTRLEAKKAFVIGRDTLFNTTQVHRLDTNLVTKEYLKGLFIPKTQNEATEEPSGFEHPEDVIVTYNSTTRKITLTGNTVALWKGDTIRTLVSGWESAAHTTNPGAWFLYYNGTDFIWSQSIWTFDMVQIAFVNYNQFAIREPHGFMDYQTHRNIHFNIGTTLTAGGDLSGYTLNTTTAAERRPLVSSSTLLDEDNPSVEPALTTESYTRFWLTSTNTSNFRTAGTDIDSLSTNQPYWNEYTGGAWQQTLFPVNAYGALWLVALPVTADAQSQAYRYLWVQPQSVSTTLSTIQAQVASSISLGNLTNATPEIVFIGKIIIRYTANNWQIISVEKLIGNKVNQQAVVAGSYLSTVATDTTLTGNGTTTNPLGVNQDDFILNRTSSYQTGGFAVNGSSYLKAGSNGNVVLSNEKVVGSVSGTATANGYIINTNTDSIKPYTTYLVSWTQSHSVANNGLVYCRLMGEPSNNITFGENQNSGNVSQIITTDYSSYGNYSFELANYTSGSVTVSNVSIKEIRSQAAPILTLKNNAETSASSWRLNYQSTYLGGGGIYQQSSATSNLSFGTNALARSVYGRDNTAIGASALASNTRGLGNTAVGQYALYSNVAGHYNIAIGKNALYNLISNTYNVAIGEEALSESVTGYSNVAIGQYAGGNGENYYGNNSIYIGAFATPEYGGQSNISEIVIGSGVVGNGSNSVTLGGDGNLKTILTGKVGINTTSPAEKLDVNGKIKTSTFQMTTGATNNYYLKSDASGNGTWAAISASQVYKGTWDASTNTPTLANGTGTAGWYYRVVVAGTVNFGAGNITFSVGDDVIYNGTIWERIPGSTYTLPTATASVLGGIKVGNSLNIASSVLDLKDGDKGDIDVTSTGTVFTLDTSSVKDYNIVFGTNANQVSTEDVPEQTNLYYTEARVDANTKVAAAYNDKINSASFNAADGVVTLTQQDAGTVTVDIDGRYVTTEVDGSITNEGAITVTGGGAASSVLHSNTSGSTDVTINVAGINTISETGSSITITGTEVDGSITNEGSLTVAAGAATTSVINSNTSGQTGVTVAVDGTNLGIGEAGNTITLSNLKPDQTVAIANGSGISVTGTYPNFTAAHSNIITAGNFGDTGASRTLAFGGTFTVPYATYDVNGHITTKSNLTLTMPASPITGTNTGDVTLATNSGLTITGQTNLALGTPTTLTDATTNAVASSTHSHAITTYTPALTYNSGTAPISITGGKVLGSALTVNVDTISTKGAATQHDLTTGLAAKQNTLTTGNLTESITGLQFDNTRQVIGGAAALSMSAGYVIPQTTDTTKWGNGYANQVASLAFSGTTTKTLTLTQRDGGTISNTFTDNNSGGTVTSVGTGLGLTGGTITTTGTIALDTANASVLSRQRAANTYQIKGTYITAETDPIFAVDSARLLHWSDTLNTTKGIASQYDLSLSTDTTFIRNQNTYSQTANFKIKGSGTLGSYLQAGLPVTVASRNKHYEIIRSGDATPVLYHQYNYFYGNYVATNNYGVGNNALLNNAGASSNGMGADALQNNLGSYSNGFGTYSLKGNTGTNSNGFGNASLQSNTANYSNGFGTSALLNNTGTFSSGFGHAALFSNNGGTSSGFGAYTLQYVTNTSSGLSAFGYAAASGTSGSPLNFDNATAIGANSTINADNSINLGDGNVTKLYFANKEVFHTPITSGTAGTANYVLTSNGATTAPTWQTPAAVDSTKYTTIYDNLLAIDSTATTYGIRSLGGNRVTFNKSSGASQWTTDRYGITYSTALRKGNVAIGNATNKNYSFYVSRDSVGYAGYFYNESVTAGTHGIKIGIGSVANYGLETNGLVKFTSYLGGVAGTPAYSLAVDATGKMITTAVPTASQWSDDTNGITYNILGKYVGIGAASDANYKLKVTGDVRVDGKTTIANTGDEALRVTSTVTEALYASSTGTTSIHAIGPNSTATILGDNTSTNFGIGVSGKGSTNGADLLANWSGVLRLKERSADATTASGYSNLFSDGTTDQLFYQTDGGTKYLLNAWTRDTYGFNNDYLNNNYNLGIGAASMGLAKVKITAGDGYGMLIDNNSAGFPTLHLTNNNTSDPITLSAIAANGNASNAIYGKIASGTGGTISVAIYGDNQSTNTASTFYYGGKFTATGGSHGIGAYLAGSKSAMVVEFNTAPTSATATGVTGEIRITADYIYVCTDINTWKRIALNTW